jgi:signal transduction histidine kinase
MRESGDRLSKLFEAIRPLSGGRRTRPPEFFRPVEPIALVKDLFSGEGVPILVSGGADAPQVIGYPDDLSTAMTNLVGNSIYWMHQAATPSAHINIRIEWNPSDVRIVVEDNGPGVPEEFADKIFNVAFTLKNGGTGLGLNIAREALERSGATLAFDPGFEEGARFIIIYEREGGKT